MPQALAGTAALGLGLAGGTPAAHAVAFSGGQCTGDVAIEQSGTTNQFRAVGARDADIFCLGVIFGGQPTVEVMVEQGTNTLATTGRVPIPAAGTSWRLLRANPVATGYTAVTPGSVRATAVIRTNGGQQEAAGFAYSTYTVPGGGCTGCCC